MILQFQKELPGKKLHSASVESKPGRVWYDNIYRIPLGENKLQIDIGRAKLIQCSPLGPLLMIDEFDQWSQWWLAPFDHSKGFWSKAQRGSPTNKHVQASCCLLFVLLLHFLAGHCCSNSDYPTQWQMGMEWVDECMDGRRDRWSSDVAVGSKTFEVYILAAGYKREKADSKVPGMGGLDTRQCICNHRRFVCIVVAFFVLFKQRMSCTCLSCLYKSHFPSGTCSIDVRSSEAFLKIPGGCARKTWSMLLTTLVLTDDTLVEELIKDYKSLLTAEETQHIPAQRKSWIWLRCDGLDDVLLWTLAPMAEDEETNVGITGQRG